MQSDENFRRYERIDFLKTGRQVRITIDFFESKTVNYTIVNGWKVVEPKTLLSYYSNIHSSDKCWAVKAAIKLLETNETVVGNELLTKNPLT